MNRKRPIDQRQMTHPEIWVDQHGDYLFRYALLRLQDAELAQDLVQDTFLAALHARHSFTGQSSERTWLVGILKHKIIDYLRRSWRECPVDEIDSSLNSMEEFFDKTGHLRDISQGWTADPGTILKQREFQRILERCLTELPSRTATAFSLREMDGLPAEEICKILDISSGNLHVLLYRARTHLRHCLEIHWFAKARKD